MWRPLIAALVLVACATPALHPFDDAISEIHGDFDGDRRRDIALMREDDEGVQWVVIVRAADAATPIEVWGGDLASSPYFSITTARPGTYHSACEPYGGCPPEVPEQVTLMHDAILVREAHPHADILYYWNGTAFQSLPVAN